MRLIRLWVSSPGPVSEGFEWISYNLKVSKYVVTASNIDIQVSNMVELECIPEHSIAPLVTTYLLT